MFGSDGVLRYDLEADRLYGRNRQKGLDDLTSRLPEIQLPKDTAGGWQVEADWVRSIREGMPVRLTDLVSGLAYMELTEAVARSAQEGVAVDVPRVENG